MTDPYRMPEERDDEPEKEVIFPRYADPDWEGPPPLPVQVLAVVAYGVRTFFRWVFR